MDAPALRGFAAAILVAAGILLGGWIWLTLVAQTFRSLLLILRCAGAA